MAALNISGARIRTSSLPWRGMDNDYALDIDQIIRTIESAEVVTFRFMLLEKRLLIDNRTNEIDGPMARLVNRVGSSEERFRSIRRMRPGFGLPDKLTAILLPM